MLRAARPLTVAIRRFLFYHEPDARSARHESVQAFRRLTKRQGRFLDRSENLREKSKECFAVFSDGWLLTRGLGHPEQLGRLGLRSRRVGDAYSPLARSLPLLVSFFFNLPCQSQSLRCRSFRLMRLWLMLLSRKIGQSLRDKNISQN